MTSTIHINDVVRIRPAYSHVTKSRTICDEFTGLCGTVVKVSSGDALIETENNREVWICVGRLAVVGVN